MRGELFLTSDLHIGHKNIIKFCSRPFKDVDHMNWELVKRWNAVVGTGDTVCILGDFIMGDFDKGIEIAKQLNGHKILVPGNHDRISPAYRISEDKRYDARIKYREAVDVIKDAPGLGHTDPETGRHFRLSHFPYNDARYPELAPKLPDPSSGKETLPLLCGHVHEAWLFQTHPPMFNVGVDVHNYAPVPFSVVRDWAAALEETGVLPKVER